MRSTSAERDNPGSERVIGTYLVFGRGWHSETRGFLVLITSIGGVQVGRILAEKMTGKDKPG